MMDVADAKQFIKELMTEQAVEIVTELKKSIEAKDMESVAKHLGQMLGHINLLESFDIDATALKQVFEKLGLLVYKKDGKYTVMKDSKQAKVLFGEGE